jgi:drug/metabolite transporter (DMT)-like permease
VSGTVLALVLFSALVHASWNAILKTTRNPEHAVLGIAATSLATSGVVAIISQVTFPTRTTLAWCLVSGLLEAGYSLTLARALARAPFGPVYTIVRGGALAVVWPLSVVFFHEKITVLRAVGTVVVVLGLASAGFSDREAKSGRAPNARGLIVAAVCALFVGAYYLAYKAALNTGGRPELVVLVSSSVSFVSILLVQGGKGRVVIDALRTDAVRILAAGMLSTLAFIAFLFAMAKSGAGLVLTLRNTSILFAQGIGFFLGEAPKRLAIVGAVLVTIGAILLTR